MTSTNQLFAHKYQLKETLGQGGFATVYKAIDTTLEREVAIKVLDARLKDAQFLARFQREAKTVAKLRHPNIIEVYEIGQYEGQHFIVMPYLPGVSLGDKIQKLGGLPMEQVLQITAQIGGALNYAHKQGIIHRDIKPANILFDQTGNAILTDFGIVKVAEESVLLTQTGAAIGTPQYMAPEQWRNKDVDERTDLYAFAIVIYQMLTGQVPFHGQTPHQIMYSHLEEQPTSPQTIKPNLPPALEHFFVTGLAKNPKQRYQTAEILVKELQNTMLEQQPTMVSAVVPPAPPSTPKPTPAKSSKVAAFGLLIGGGIVVALLVIIGLIGWFISQGSNTPDIALNVATSSLQESVTTPETVQEEQPSPTPPLKIRDTSTPRATKTPVAEIKANPTAMKGTPTESIKIPAPTIIEPLDGATFRPNSNGDLLILLRWSGDKLAANNGEQFKVLLLNNKGETIDLPTYGITQNPELRLPNDLAIGKYTWLVAIQKKNETNVFEDISTTTSSSFEVLPIAEITATPTTTPTPQSAKIAIATATPIPATATPASSKRALVGLTAPTIEQVFTGREAAIEFHWQETQPPLAEIEYYVLIIKHRSGEDRTWLKTNHYLLPENKRWLNDQGPDLSWRVVIAQKRSQDENEDPRGAEMSDYSEEYKFIWTSSGGGSDGGKDSGGSSSGGGGGGIN